MNTFTTSQGEAGKNPALTTPSSNATASPKNIDLNTVYMFLEELKLSFEKGQAKQSDSSQVQTEVYNPEVFENILLKAMSGIDFRFNNPIPDLSKLPKPKDYSQNSTDLGTKIEKKDSETAKALNTMGSTMTKLEAAIKSNTAAVDAGPRYRKLRRLSSLTSTHGNVSLAWLSASLSVYFSVCGLSSRVITWICTLTLT